MDFKVIAVDPGGTTGYTIARKTGAIINIIADQQKMSCARFYDFLWTHRRDAQHVIVEDFEFRKGARAGLDLTPAHLIGVAYAVMGDDERLRMQKASVGKAHFKNDDKIKELGLWIPGKPHAIDSLRHFLQWYFFGPGYQYHDKSIVIRLDPLRPN